MRAFFYYVLLTLVSQAVFAQKSSIELVHLKLNQDEAKMAEIREFYKGVLGLKLVSPEGAIKRDYLEFDNGQRLNLIYVSKERVPDQRAFMNGMWIRLETTDFNTLVEKVMASGVPIVKEVTGKELYFQAPGGQVWRMVKKE